MAATNSGTTGGGSAVSFTNTPQAKDDAYSSIGLTENSTSVFLLDVLANDLGGAAKKLYSLDSGDNVNDLLGKDGVSSQGLTSDRSALGARIWITADGKIGYDASTLAGVQQLGAGETAEDSFVYAIQLGNGTLSWARVTLVVAGVNDAVVIVSAVDAGSVLEAADGSAGENASTHTAAGSISFGDADLSDTHSVSFTPAGGGYRGGFSAVLADDSTGDGSGAVSWNFAVADADLDNLARGETLIQRYTVTVDDGHGGSASQVVTITLTGTNDAPVIAVVSAAGATQEDVTLTATGRLTASDVDNGATQSWSVDGGGAGTYGSLAVDGTGAWTYTLNNTAANVQALARGETVNESFTVRVADEHGAVDSEIVSLSITGTNDAPVIEVVSNSGAVTEDGALSASGQLTATDVDHGAFLRWSVDGGTATQTADYAFRMDNLNIRKNGSLFFNDPFSDGNPPPSAPTFGDGVTPASYFVTGALSESGGRLLLNGSAAVPILGIGTPDPFVGTFALLRTDINPADLTRGLKIDDNFTVEGRFDLVIPDGIRQAYGVRLSDRLLGGPGTPPDQAGDDMIDLLVRRGADGLVRVQLIEFDAVADTSRVIGGVTLNAAPGENQIVLRLSHDAATPGVVRASFDLLTAGAVTHSVTLAQTGEIFGSETPGNPGDDENWTRAQIVSWSPAETGGTVIGAHGTLSVGIDGQWTYTLNNGAANVQSLAEGETATDTFTVRVADEYGASDSEIVTVDITGTNDAPVINPIIAAGFAFEDGSQVALGQLGAEDVDHGARLTWSVDGGGAGTHGTLALTNQEGSWSYTLDNGAAQVQALAQGERVVEQFTVRVTDEHGASDTETVTVTVTGTNDRPVAVDDTYTPTALAGDALLTFEGVDGYPAFDYQGFHFSGNDSGYYSFFVIYPYDFGVNGTGSAYTYGYGTYYTGGEIQRTDGADFGVVSVDAASYYNYGSQVSFLGYNDGALVGNLTTSVDPYWYSPYGGANGHIEFGPEFSQIDQLLVIPAYDYVFLDNLSIGSSVTENFVADIDVLANDTDVDHGAVLSVSALDAASAMGAAVSLNPDGTVHYSSIGVAAIDALAEGETASDSFSYTVTDEHGATDTATVTIGLLGQNDGPVAVDDVIAGGGANEVLLDFNGSVDLTNYQGYALDGFFYYPYGYGDGDNTMAYTYIYRNVSGETDGVIRRVDGEDFSLESLRANGYYSTNDTTVRGYDDGALVASQTISLVPSTYQTYTFGGGWSSVDEVRFESGYDYMFMDNVRLSQGHGEDDTADINVLANDYDVDTGDTITLTSFDATSAKGAAVSRNADGSLHYDSTGSAQLQGLNDGETLTDTFSYTITDTHGATDTATVSVTVHGENDAPVALDDSYTAHEDVLQSVAAPGLLSNDSDVDQGTQLQVNAGTISSSMGASVVLNSDGSFTYDARNASAIQALNDGQFADDSFSYTVTDGNGGSATANVAVRVTGATDNHAPVARDDTLVGSGGAASLVSQTLWGGSGDQRFHDVDYGMARLWLAGEANIGINQSYAVAFNDGNLASPSMVRMWNQSGNTEAFFDVAVSPSISQAVFAGMSYASTYDGVGGKEAKADLLSLDPTGATRWFRQADVNGNEAMYSYTGTEAFNTIAASVESGQTYYYAAGGGEPYSYFAMAAVKFDVNGNRVAQAPDPSLGTFSPGFFSAGSSQAYDVMVAGSKVYLAGYTGWSAQGDPSGRPALWTYSTSLGHQASYKDSTLFGTFNGVATLNGEIYAVGQRNNSSNTGADYLIEKFDQNGNFLWRSISGTAGEDSLQDIVLVGNRLFATGYTNGEGAGGYDAVLAEIDPTTGALLSKTLFGGANDDRGWGLTTDGANLFVAGESRSFALGGNGAGQNDGLLLKYTPSQGFLEDTPITITQAKLLANDSDADGDTLTVSSVGDAQHGSVAFSGGNIVFTPNANYFGSASFTYTASDGKGGISNAATVSLTVNPVNDAPVAEDGRTVQVAEGAVNVPLGIVSPTDVDGDALSVRIDSLPNNGNVTLASGATISNGQTLSLADLAGLRITAGVNANNSSSALQYTVTDGRGGSDSASVQISTYDVSTTGPQQVLTFDDLPSSQAIPTGYGGFDWFSITTDYYLNDIGTYNYGNSYSAPNVAIPFYGPQDTAIARLGGEDFTFAGAYFARQWSVSEIVLTGIRDGNVVGSSTYFIGNSDGYLPYTWIAPNFGPIDRLNIHSNFNGATWWRMDNFTFSVGSGTANLTLNGGSGADVLVGGAGNDSLSGQGGNDVLAGAAGSDTLTGGAGADRFDYNSITDGIDTIVDFKRAEGDKLDIRDLLVGYNPATPDDFVQFAVSGGNTTVRVDANGAAGGASFTPLATLQGVTDLLLSDLIVSNV